MSACKLPLRVCSTEQQYMYSAKPHLLGINRDITKVHFCLVPVARGEGIIGEVFPALSNIQGTDRFLEK